MRREQTLKRILTLALTLALCLGLCPMTAFAASSGSCGGGVSWTLDDSGTLTISGSGPMEDFTSSPPWYGSADEVRTIRVTSGVTSIGDRAFMRCKKAVTVSIADSVTKIGDYAFFECKGLTDVVIPDGVDRIGRQAFGSCTLSSVTIPATTNIGYWAFVGAAGPNNPYYQTTVSYKGTQAQWEEIAQGWLVEYPGHDMSSFTDPSTEAFLFGNGGDDAPKVRILGTSSPSAPVVPTYTVLFCNPLNMSYSTPIQVTNGQPYGKLPTPAAMSGRDFAGWYTADGDKITEDTIVDLTRDQTLFAHWDQTTLTHANVPSSSGVVELSNLDGTLEAFLSVPASGKRITRWELNIYTTSGTLVGTAGENLNTVVAGDNILYMRIWSLNSSTKDGDVIEIQNEDFTLTVGTVYVYEFNAVLDGESYTTGRARFRLNASSARIAYSTTQTVNLDGKSVKFETYALRDVDGNDTNYIKIRDLALALNGTAAQFAVDWDGVVNLRTGMAYTPNGSENHTPFSGDRTYSVPEKLTNVNGSASSLRAIVLTDDDGGDYTYYKLRDVGRVLGFNVGYADGVGVFIQTDRPYTDAD